MVTHSIVLQRLRGLDSYLLGHPVGERPTLFEKLVCEAFACAFHLPFFDQSHDDASQAYRVTWLGSEKPLQKSPGGPDGVVRAHEFSVVVDATLKTGTTQWSQEFARCLEHIRQTAKEVVAQPAQMHAVLVVKTLAEDTFASVKAHNGSRNPSKLLPMETEQLELLTETAELAFTLRHLDIRRLLRDGIECLRHASDLQDFRDRFAQCGRDWQKSVLALERQTVFGIKSCEVLVAENRRSVGVSEILNKLIDNPVAGRYAQKMGTSIGPQEVAEGLKQESLGVVVGKLPDGEELFAPVPLTEFKSRCGRRTKAVEGAHERK